MHAVTTDGQRSRLGPFAWPTLLNGLRPCVARLRNGGRHPNGAGVDGDDRRVAITADVKHRIDEVNGLQSPCRELMPGRRYLVTGCAGFIGSHLTQALTARGCSVVGVDDFSDNYPRSLKERNLRRAASAGSPSRRSAPSWANR
jgi:hypothetical protein